MDIREKNLIRFYNIIIIIKNVGELYLLLHLIISRNIKKKHI